jgi:3-deoxy-D-manno-octulosonate 8-phosphate phosphatase (KDO 8-P phosphatase)
MSRALPLEELKIRGAKIRCMFLDIDGVLTDGKLYIGANFEETKTNYVRDGYGIKQMLKAGLEIAVISGRASPAMQKRMDWLGVKHVVLDNEDKEPQYLRIRDRLGLADEQCAHVGDDVPDLPVLRRVGLACTVADAHPRALAVAHFVTRSIGGHGGVREVIDLIMESQGLLP